MSADVDVVVVGAGFAGLAAATHLVEGGASVVVLEAAGRVGGRTDTVWRGPDGSVGYEIGGQWTGPGQTRVAALADRFGVERFDTPSDGDTMHVSGGTAAVLDGDPAYVEVVSALDELASTVPTETPWDRSLAALDDMPMSDWLEQNVADPATRTIATRVLEGLMTVSTDQMSVLTVLHGAVTSGTLSAALGIEGGAQEQRVVGGLHGLARHLADDLGDVVRLSSPVRRICESAGGVDVDHDGGRVRASRVVLAVPPSGWHAIAFEPALPPAHAALTDLMPLGSVIKVQLVFERPFWRQAGCSGLIVDDVGPFAFVADNSVPGADEGVLVSFLSAADAVAWGDAAWGADAAVRRREAFAEHVRTAFGVQSPDPIDYLDRDWCAVPWVGGGYSGVMKPGGWMRTGPALREPVGRVHFASAESAHEWNGYVEGALDAGARASAEVLAVG